MNIDAQNRVHELQKKTGESEKGQDGSNQFIKNFMKYRNIDKLTREVVAALIEMIYVYEDKKIKIVFKYQNPFREAMEYIENNRNLLERERAEIIPEESVVVYS